MFRADLSGGGPAAALLLLWAFPAFAQDECGPALPDEPFTVTVLTTSPGPDLFTAFGHVGLWVSGGGLPEDEVFNWGTFDSTKQEPLSTFFAGSLEAWLAVEDTALTLRRAEAGDRTVVAQHLDLPPPMVVALRADLAEAARPENRAYRYHWFDHNCATVVRDLLDHATGGALRAVPMPGATPLTPRREVSRHVAPKWWAWLALNFIGSSHADRSITPFESMFLPDRLMQALGEARVSWPDGTERKLVDERCTLRAGGSPWPSSSPPRREIPLLALGLAWAAGIVATRRSTVAGLLVGVLGLVAGALGTATVVLATASAMVGFGTNENWFTGSPATLLLVPAAWSIATGGRHLAGSTRTVTTGLAAVGLAGLAFHLLPWSHQDDLAFTALFLPPLLAAATVARCGVRRR